MNAETQVDLEVLESAIAADIKLKFPLFRTVEFYREDRKSIPLPAVLLEMVEWEYDEDNDPGTEQLAILANFEATVLIGIRPEAGRKAKAMIRTITTNLAAWMYNRRWDDPARPGKKLPTGPVQLVGAFPDDFAGLGSGQRDKNLDQFEIWRISWNQKVHIGESVWPNGGTIPEILYSFSPDTGAIHRDDYVPIGEGGPSIE